MFKNKYGQVRSGWVILAVLVTFYVAMLLVLQIFSIILMLFTLQNEAVDAAFVELMNESQWFMVILQDAVMVAVPVFVWTKLMKRRLPDMGLPSIKNNGKELISGLLLGAGVMALVFGALLLTGNARVVDWTPHFSPQTIQYLLVFIMVGIGEEVLGRGFIMATLRQTKNIPAVIAVSSIIFSLMHIQNNAYSLVPFINIALVGVLFAVMFIRSGNIWMPIGYHIAWNYFQGPVFGFEVSGTQSVGLITTKCAAPNIFNGGAFGPEGGLIVTAAILMSYALVEWRYRKNSYDFLTNSQTEHRRAKSQNASM